MITCITILDKRPLLALVQDDSLVLMTELNPNNLLQDLYSKTAGYKIDTLKFLMRLNLESNISSTVLDDVLKVSDINIRGMILSAVASPNDLIALTNFGVVLGANKVEVFDYIRVYKAMVEEKTFIGVDEWNDGYLVIVKSGESLKECNKFYDVNLKSRVLEYSSSYGIDEFIHLGEYFEDNYEFSVLRDTKYYYPDQNARVKNKIMIIDFLMSNTGEVLSQEDEVFPIDLPMDEDEEDLKEDFSEEFEEDVDFTQEMSRSELRKELEEHKKRRRAREEEKPGGFFSRLFGKK